MKKTTEVNFKELCDVVIEKFDDAQTPGASVEFDPEEAELAGAFEEDSISEQEAIESSIDQVAEDTNK